MGKKTRRVSLMDIEPSPTEPDPVVQSIAAPEAGAHLRRRGVQRRKREWERANPAQRYLVPSAYRERAEAVRGALLGLSQQYHTTVSVVAAALMRAALDAVREGEIQLQFLPNAQGRKMAVEVVRGGWPQEELPKPKHNKRKAKPLNLTYRWGKELHQEIVNLAGDAPLGAVVVLLLEASLERIKSGKWGLRPRAVTVRQDVKVVQAKKR